MTKPKPKPVALAMPATPANPPVKPQSVPTSPQKPKKARGHYGQKECPFCHRIVGNLPNHVKLKHPAESPPASEPTKDTLLGGHKPPPTTTPSNKYYCLECNGVLRKGEETCWQCGISLNWEGIE